MLALFVSMESNTTSQEKSGVENLCSNPNSNSADKTFLEPEDLSNILSGQRNEDGYLHKEGSDDDDVEWEDEVGEEEEHKLALGLIGRLWTERNVNPNAFMNTIKSLWALKHGLEISLIGKNKFQFQFHHWRDKRKVVDGQPWHFDHLRTSFG